MGNAFIEIEGLAKTFSGVGADGALNVFEDVWFDIQEGEFVALVGHSG
jgi:ABC-type glutathione transport system ATPase component